MTFNSQIDITNSKSNNNNNNDNTKDTKTYPIFELNKDEILNHANILKQRIKITERRMEKEALILQLPKENMHLSESKQQAIKCLLIKYINENIDDYIFNIEFVIDPKSNVERTILGSIKPHPFQSYLYMIKGYPVINLIIKQKNPIEDCIIL